MTTPSPTPESQAAEPAGLKLGDLLAIWRKRKWMILAIVTAIPMLVAFVVSKQPKVYEASASVVIDSFVPQYLGQQFKDVVEIESNWWTAQEMLQTELKVLKSYSQAVAVAKALCDKKVGNETTPALKHFLPDATCTNPDEFGRAAPMLQGSLSVLPMKDSRVVILTSRNNNPQMAALIANVFAQVYAERNLERRIAQSEGAATWLGDEYGDLTVQLNSAERALIDFKQKNGVVAVHIEDQQNDLAMRRKKLSEELNIAQVKLISLKALREQYKELRGDDPMSELTPGVVDSPVVVKLKELYVDQYSKLVELRGKYLEKHPTVLAQEARLATIKTDLQREASLAQKNIDAQFAALGRQEKDLKAAIDTATREALQLESRAIEYNRLKRNFDRLSKLSEQVGGRERETSLAGHLRTNNVRILDAALVPSGHISPNLFTSVAGSVAIAFVLALGLAFLLELLDSSVKTQDDIEKTIGVTFLGVIPTIEDGVKGAPVLKGSKDLYVLNHPKSAVAECCRAIRTNLLFMTPDRPAKTLLVTSGSPQEGKTTTAVNLAVTLAQSGLKVLLVDTDLRRPRLHKAFGIPSTPDGVSKAILGESDVFDMIRETGVPGLDLLPCGATPPNPAELLHAERFKRIVEQLSERYDRVIFDSPPVGAVTDATILARLTMGTVLVAQSGRTAKDALARARRLLGFSGVNVLGCILNDLDLSKQGSYGYYYYSRYGYYSRDGESDGGKPDADAIKDS
jgi:polysaccharide biosynthesis transport protein